MTRALPRAHLHRSRLLRFLSEHALLDDATTEGDVGEKLGDWLDFRQAIALHAVLNPEPGTAAPLRRTQAAPQTLANNLTDSLNSLRSALESAVMQTGPAAAGLLSIPLPVADLAPPLEAGKPLKPQEVFEPYRRYYSAHQRQMETAVRRLRAQARAAASQSTPALQQLAVLDNSFEGIFKEREAKLLGTVALKMEKRFGQLLKQHLKAHADQIDEDNPGSDPTGAAWQAAFGRDLQTALLAELDLRLQPTIGLVEALNQESQESN